MSGSTRQKHTRAFTLVELLVSIAIIGILTSIVTLRYQSFDGTVLLKSAAYDIALALREVQVKASSISRGVEGICNTQTGSSDCRFDYPYGMSFEPNSKEYIAFQYASSTSLTPYYDINEMVTPKARHLATSTIGRTMYVSDVCVTNASNATLCSADGITRLDVSFKRPEYKGIVCYRMSGNNTVCPQNIIAADVKVSTPTGKNTFVVTVSALGQISVAKQ